MAGPFDLTGKVAIVTGGNGGIGLGMARGLGAAGAKLAIVGRNAGKCENACKELKGEGIEAVPVVADLVSAEAARGMVAATMKAFGRLDIIVCNAGINQRKAPETYTEDEWSRIINVNLDGVFYSCQAAYPELKKAGGGKIITIGSMTSIFGVPFAAAYSASKGGVMQLTRALACAWAADNIQVNCVLPGWINSDLTRNARKNYPELHDKVLARTPAGRWGDPEDLAGIGVFLAGSGSDFVTGTAIPVDGGYAAQG